MAAFCVRDAVERAEKFRLVTAEKPDFGISMNTPTEMGIAVRFPFLVDFHLAASQHPLVKSSQTLQDLQNLFNMLRLGRAKHRWHDGGHWRSLCRQAMRADLEGAQEALDAQAADEAHAAHPPTWRGLHTTVTRDLYGGFAVRAEDGRQTYVRPGDDANALEDMFREEEYPPEYVDGVVGEYLEGVPAVG